ncbi:MAG: D-glycero-beta-D-manno-heptose 1,7-bisphosphate 7-phosphatase [Burkholderiales bacterium]|nr:D-glycero-beta-D-manno-heptose 1,7-bisphosphate 7-phosphatase [Burkholderiales bacterium]
MKLLILDRDGTLNMPRDDFITTPDEWVPLPGALEAVARLNQAGWKVVLATNQPGIGRGLMDVSVLNAIHQKMNRALAAVGGRVEAVFFCPHVPDDRCRCRKPGPGLLEQIGERFATPVKDVHMAGDSIWDVQAACAAGMQPHLLLTGNSTHLRDAPLPALPPGTRVHADLAAFAQALLENSDS